MRRSSACHVVTDVGPVQLPRMASVSRASSVSSR